jgi:hypothetical protein
MSKVVFAVAKVAETEKVAAVVRLIEGRNTEAVRSARRLGTESAVVVSVGDAESRLE